MFELVVEITDRFQDKSDTDEFHWYGIIYISLEF